ncbi:TM0106 family RecB-like putative nuclease [Trichocoleus sp. DQ-A3]|uniref:TM0106 family RecB-like putative nuclease n=1 Tax=Cyanophyceae TaxID=3028117 RepID=UPI0016858B1C|nr:TM0106 family RecB-like putative nuclease [Coleofasciculus sp. FACHB-125]MBD1899667.1 TM0106 family RecB-like putative nuclease [Coleofasciculus sp. FACHB-125]
MLLTVNMLRHYQRCSRRSFLDLYGDPTQQDFQSDFRAKLQQDRYALQQTILAGQTYHKPNYAWGDWHAGANATIALMQEGVELIYRGVLLKEEEVRIEDESFLHLPKTVTLVSCPDFLVKQPGQSNFGDWIYVPSDIHLGRRPKLEYQTVAAFHAHLLASVQGVLPDTVWLRLREKKAYAVNLSKWVPMMQALVEECIEMLLSRQEPEVFITRQRCNLCPWLNHCYAIAQEQQHLSLIPGVTPSRYQHLQTLELTSRESLAGVSPAFLEPALGEEVAQQLVQQAQSVVENRAMLLEKPFAIAKTTKTAEWVMDNPSSLLSPIELYFDIEAEPSLELDYLLGVLVVDRQANTETFYPFLAEQPSDEELVWQQFLDLVWTYPQAPIFHFCDYEILTMKRLAKCYNTPLERLRPVLSRFVDIHEWVTGMVTLPVESYALKAIAHWLGFEWRDAGANGQVCIYWYDQWLKTRDRTFLDAILRYNEDDCRATRHLKDWLVDFMQDAAHLDARE